MAEIEGAIGRIGRQFQSLSIVFVCAVNTKLASLQLSNQVPTPDIYGAHCVYTTNFGGPSRCTSTPSTLLLNTARLNTAPLNQTFKKWRM
jgi:hypothetical protein